MAGDESPANQSSEHRNLKPVERCHHAAAQARAEIIERAESEQDEGGEGCGRLGG